MYHVRMYVLGPRAGIIIFYMVSFVLYYFAICCGSEMWRSFYCRHRTPPPPALIMHGVS
jgi:hypothetical protein